jgi:hypothetical protein
VARHKDIDRIERPDIEMGARVKAKRLRFERVPETEVEFFGDHLADSVSGSERKNLPEEVEPGRTYEDVEVRWRAAARIGRRRPASGDG